MLSEMMKDSSQWSHKFYIREKKKTLDFEYTH